MTRCAICGHATKPYAYIGSEPIGPTCARKAGIVPAKVPKGGRVQFASKIRASREEQPDLFEGEPEDEPKL